MRKTRCCSALKHRAYKPQDLYAKNILSLPRLPIPAIEKTLQGYENSVIPLKQPDEIQPHLEMLQKFRDGSASRLNERLIESDKATAQKTGKYPFNYVEEQWDKNFLAFRGCSPINISPAVALKPIPRINGTQCGVAAEYVHACMRWYTKLQSGKLDLVGFEKHQRMDVSQLPTQFGCCRLSHGELDTKQVTLSPKHIIVLYKAHVFEVEIMQDGKAMSAHAIQRALSAIVSSTTEENPTPIGILSTGGRNDLVEYTQEIESVGENAALLDSVNSAFLTVCLDSYPASDNDVKLQAALHGVGRDRNNRWFDKNQLIVSKDGYVAMNFEHAFSDKATWARWLNEVWNELNGTCSATPYTKLPKLPLCSVRTAPFRPLNFEIPESMQGILNSAKLSWRSAAKDLYQGSLVADFGVRRLKKYKIDPDAFAQMAFHLAFYRLSGRMAPTYRSVSTASFFHGRTETVRSATREMFAFVRSKGLADPTELSLAKLREVRVLAETAARKHAEISREASQGMGMDRHLLALNALVAADQTSAFSDATELFDSPIYTYSGNWQMYTTNATFPFFDSYCTGPVMEHGYGLGYIIQDEHVTCSVSAFLSSRKANGPAMRDAILQAMRDIAVIFEADQVSR